VLVSARKPALTSTAPADRKNLIVVSIAPLTT